MFSYSTESWKATDLFHFWQIWGSNPALPSGMLGGDENKFMYSTFSIYQGGCHGRAVANTLTYTGSFKKGIDKVARKHIQYLTFWSVSRNILKKPSHNLSTILLGGRVVYIYSSWLAPFPVSPTHFIWRIHKKVRLARLTASIQMTSDGLISCDMRLAPSFLCVQQTDLNCNCWGFLSHFNLEYEAIVMHSAVTYVLCYV